MEGLISCKTRSGAVTLPPVGSLVFLHASKALWSGWKDLWWTADIDVRCLPRGGVVGVARVLEVGAPARTVVPEADQRYFRIYDGTCMDWQAIRFGAVERIPFIPCRGSLAPTRKLPPEVAAYVGEHPELLV
jgi:hypothetical protein